MPARRHQPRSDALNAGQRPDLSGNDRWLSSPTADRAGSLPTGPLYGLIAQALQQRIYYGLYQPGQRIPSENELAREFGVSRMTVRQALRELNARDLLVGRRGAGTFVTDTARILRPVNFIGSLEDLVLQAVAMTTEVGQILTQDPSDELRARLQLRRNQSVIAIERIRSVDSEPASHSWSYLPASIGRRLDPSSLTETSMTALLAQTCGIQITSASQTFTAEPAPADVARHLQLPAGAAVLRSDIVLSDATRPRQAAVVRYHPARVFFTATLRSAPRPL